MENPYFEKYGESLVPLTWREANRKFEEDVFSYLLAVYQHNNTKITKVLNVSYQQVVQKTGGTSLSVVCSSVWDAQ